MRKLIAATLVAGLAAGTAMSAAAPAAAAAPDPKDIECLVFTYMVASSSNQSEANAGALGAFYFLGKIDGTSPGADLDGPVAASFTGLKQGDLDALGKRCFAELQSRSAKVTAMGAQLQKLSPPPAATAAPAAPPAPATPAPAPAPAPKKK